MATKIQLRGDTAYNWTLVNPILAEREFVLETDTLLVKMGDGITHYNSLNYAIDKTTNIKGGNSTTLKGSIPYQNNTDTTLLLSPNVTTTKKFLRSTGDATNGTAPAWDTIVLGDLPSGLLLTAQTVSQSIGDTTHRLTKLWATDGEFTNMPTVGGTSLSNIFYHTGNLTNNLGTNYIPKWNGSSFVNSLISDDGTTTTTNVGSNQFLKIYYSSLFSGGVTLKSRYANTYDNAAIHLGASAVDAGSLSLMTAANSTTGLVNRLTIDSDGKVSILATTASASSTTGALVVGGGIGVGGQMYINGTSGLPSNSGASMVGGLRLNASNNAVMDFGVDHASANGWIQSSDKTEQNYHYGLLLNPLGSNVMVGYTADQGYKLAVNGNGYFNGRLTVAGLINTMNYTVSTLPAGTRGDVCYVTDALAPTFLTIIAGGGAVVTPVFFNGTNWIGF